jgi:hypothetical protein
VATVRRDVWLRFRGGEWPRFRETGSQGSGGGDWPGSERRVAKVQGEGSGQGPERRVAKFQEWPRFRGRWVAKVQGEVGGPRFRRRWVAKVQGVVGGQGPGEVGNQGLGRHVAKVSERWPRFQKINGLLRFPSFCNQSSLSRFEGQRSGEYHLTRKIYVEI